MTCRGCEITTYTGDKNKMSAMTLPATANIKLGQINISKLIFKHIYNEESEWIELKWCVCVYGPITPTAVRANSAETMADNEIVKVDEDEDEDEEWKEMRDMGLLYRERERERERVKFVRVNNN